MTQDAPGLILKLHINAQIHLMQTRIHKALMRITAFQEHPDKVTSHDVDLAYREFTGAVQDMYLSPSPDDITPFRDWRTADQGGMYIQKVGKEILGGQNRLHLSSIFLRYMGDAACLSQELPQTQEMFSVAAAHLLPICAHPDNNKNYARDGGAISSYTNQMVSIWHATHVRPELRDCLRQALKENIRYVDEKNMWPDQQQRNELLSLIAPE